MEEKDFGKYFQHLGFPKSRISGPSFKRAGFRGDSNGGGGGLLHLEIYITDLIRPSQ